MTDYYNFLINNAANFLLRQQKAKLKEDSPEFISPFDISQSLAVCLAGDKVKVLTDILSTMENKDD